MMEEAIFDTSRDALLPFESIIPSEVVRVMNDFRAERLCRIMGHLRRQGVLRGHNAIPMSMVAPGDRGYLIRAAHRAQARIEKEKQTLLPADVWAYLRQCIRGNKQNASKRDREFQLTMDDLKKLFIRANGKCEVTGVPFTLETYGTPRAPFAPSIDRIDCAKGYTFSNVRLVCQISNLAMNAWGSAVLMEFLAKASNAQSGNPK